jgi:hypothetical protein
VIYLSHVHSTPTNPVRVITHGFDKQLTEDEARRLARSIDQRLNPQAVEIAP